MDLSLNALWNNIIRRGSGSGLTEIEFLELELQAWIDSGKRNQMIVGKRYFDGDHDILNKQRQAVDANGNTRTVNGLPNNRIVDNRYAELGYDRGRRELQRLDELNSKGYGPLLRQVYAGDIQSCYELGRVYLELSRTAATLQEQEGRRKFGLRLLHKAATQGHETARLLYNQEAQNNHQPEQKLFNEEALRESNI